MTPVCRIFDEGLLPVRVVPSWSGTDEFHCGGDYLRKRNFAGGGGITRVLKKSCQDVRLPQEGRVRKEKKSKKEVSVLQR